MGKIYRFTLFFDKDFDDYKTVITNERQEAVSPEGYPLRVDTFLGRSTLSYDQMTSQGYVVQIA